MKRFTLAAALVAMMVLTTPRALAQDNVAAAIAERQEAEERYKRLAATVEDLKEAQTALTRQIKSLADELQKSREEAARSGNKFASQDDLKLLTEKLREVDAKRQADNERILGTLEKLAKAPPAARPADPAPVTKPAHVVTAHAANEKGYWYEIKANDTLSGVVKSYRDQGVKVTLKKVQDANPTINPARLKVGEKVFVPDAGQP